MRVLAGQVGIVTGASSGIGRALALALAKEGASLCLVGRDRSRLAEVADAARGTSPQVVACVTDLAEEDAARTIRACADAEFARVDLLVHAAGVIEQGTLREASPEALDRQLAVNARAPWALTRALLPRLVETKGQVVFLNSSVVFRTAADVGAYGASKHALLAIADSLRDEVNPLGIRVLSVFIGKTATPLQAKLHAEQGTKYRPERLLQPEDVASAVLSAISLPRTAEVTEIRIRPMLKG